MRQVVIPVTPLRCGSLAQAFDQVFGPRMIRKVHGESTRVSPFVHGRRTIQFCVDVGKVPLPIRTFFCGGSLRVTADQTVHKTDTKWDITNCVTMHFVGSELFRMKPAFWLDTESGHVYLGGTVRHDAVLPYPLNKIAEGFMARRSEHELRHFARCLTDEDVIAPQPEQTTVQTP